MFLVLYIKSLPNSSSQELVKFMAEIHKEILLWFLLKVLYFYILHLYHIINFELMFTYALDKMEIYTFWILLFNYSSTIC